MIPLGPSAHLLSHHVDRLELTCRVTQVPYLLHGGPDALEAKLKKLQLRAAEMPRPAPLPSGWTWGKERERVLAVPWQLRPRYPYAVRCSDWQVFVAPAGAHVPRMNAVLFSAYLLRVGPLRAHDEARRWVATRLLPLIGGRPADDEPVWRITRLDLAADVCGVDLALQDYPYFTSRARRRRTYIDREQDAK